MKIIHVPPTPEACQLSTKELNAPEYPTGTVVECEAHSPAHRWVVVKDLIHETFGGSAIYQVRFELVVEDD